MLSRLQLQLPGCLMHFSTLNVLIFLAQDYRLARRRLRKHLTRDTTEPNWVLIYNLLNTEKTTAWNHFQLAKRYAFGYETSHVRLT